jgi:phosphopantetheine adenylyltransferase
MSRVRFNKEIDAVSYKLEILRNHIRVKYVTKYSDLIIIVIHKPNFSKTEYSIVISEETYNMLTKCNDNDIRNLMILNIINKNKCLS